MTKQVLSLLSTKALRSVSATLESVIHSTPIILMMVKRDQMKELKTQARWKKFSDRRSRRQTKRSAPTSKSSSRCHRDSSLSSSVRARTLQDRSCARVKEIIQVALCSLRGSTSITKLRVAATALYKLTRSKSRRGLLSPHDRGFITQMTRLSRFSQDKSLTLNPGQLEAL